MTYDYFGGREYKLNRILYGIIPEKFKIEYPRSVPVEIPTVDVSADFKSVCVIGRLFTPCIGKERDFKMVFTIWWAGSLTPRLYKDEKPNMEYMPLPERSEPYQPKLKPGETPGGHL